MGRDHMASAASLIRSFRTYSMSRATCDGTRKHLAVRQTVRVRAVEEVFCDRSWSNLAKQAFSHCWRRVLK